ncbi:Lipase, GDSL [Corchorus olitorius]|uniref:Lipase, GDSL n=1 Tax=Corchorus olitorius TaxID=93759 RepID=A0A1R3GBW3_9ROSI|nr:Lipase, GDSL [Corchorus olitorius]
MLVLLHPTILNLLVVHAQKNCDFPAIINLGDSNSDTGGYAACFTPPTSPYGDTYFHRPARRFSDGRLVIDFIGFFANLTIQQVNASVPDIVNNFSANVKNLYSSGGRSFWIHNTGPIGCLPYVLTAFSSAERDSAGCLKPHNEVAQYFNLKLKEAVAQLRNEFPSAAFTYVDIYSVKYSLFAEPQKHGFELPLVTCCGYGGQYNYSAEVLCGGTIRVNGTEIFVGSCERPSVRVVWDGIHYTEAANKFVYDQISTGSFSDPPIPLKQACQRT